MGNELPFEEMSEVSAAHQAPPAVLLEEGLPGPPVGLLATIVGHANRDMHNPLIGRVAGIQALVDD